MPRYFVDTSALVKRYHAERGTDVVDVLFAEPLATRLVSRLGLVETISAFAMKVRTGEIAEADRLLQRHATSKRLRTLDALQLSVALDLKRRDLIDQFISSDQILVELAQSEGLTAINPNP